MIDTIIFDIGNVLMRYDVASYGKKMLDNEKALDVVAKVVWASGLWDEMDRGVDPDFILSEMIKLEPDYEEEIRLLIKNCGESIHRVDYAIPWIKELKAKGKRLLYLSNYSEYTRNANLEALDFLPYLDGGVFSYEVKSIKPEPEIYKILIDKYDLIPENCVFLDDTLANIEAAKKFGFNTIHVTKPEKGRELLDEFLKRCMA